VPRRSDQQAITLWKWMQAVELYFTCPLTGKGFLIQDWEIAGELQIEKNRQGPRKLRGKVAVTCPHCEAMHVYATEELVCPLTKT